MSLYPTRTITNPNYAATEITKSAYILTRDIYSSVDALREAVSEYVSRDILVNSIGKYDNQLGEINRYSLQPFQPRLKDLEWDVDALEEYVLKPNPADMGPEWEVKRNTWERSHSHAEWEEHYKQFCNRRKKYLPLLMRAKNKLAEVRNALKEAESTCETERARCQAKKKDMDEAIAAYNRKKNAWRTIRPSIFLGYGKVNGELIALSDRIREEGLTFDGKGGTVKEVLSLWERDYGSGKVLRIGTIHPEVLPLIALSLARTKPVDILAIRRCSDLFYSLTSTNNNTDLMIADYYAKKVIGGDDAVVKETSELTRKQSLSQRDAESLASGLMWMECYRAERDVLGYMLSKGMHMPEKAQERLHFLSTDSKAPAARNVGSDGAADILIFDTSSVSWSQDQLSSFFDNLSFQERTLGYALAVRVSDESIAVPRSTIVPSMEVLGRELSDLFYEEYGDDAHIRTRRCIVFADGVEEEIDAFDITATAISNMAIVAILEKIGRRLTVKSYTLYVPTGNNRTDSGGMASLLRRLNPRQAMWEDGLKETLLDSIVRVLNSDSGTLSEPMLSETVF